MLGMDAMEGEKITESYALSPIASARKLYYNSSAMANCVVCGAETQLMVGGVPICLKCDEGIGRNRKKATSESRP